MNPNNITAPESLAAYNKMLTEVLQPRPPAILQIEVPFVIVPEHGAAAQVADKAVRELQHLAIRYTCSVNAQAEPERFQTECAETGYLTGHDLSQTLAKTDIVLAATVRTLFHRAFADIRALPTTLRVQVCMQLIAETAARTMRPLLLRQAGLC